MKLFILFIFVFILNLYAFVLQILREIIKEYPDYYLDEIVRETSKEISISTLWSFLRYCGITRKKVIVFITFYILIIL